MNNALRQHYKHVESDLLRYHKAIGHVVNGRVQWSEPKLGHRVDGTRDENTRIGITPDDLIIVHDVDRHDGVNVVTPAQASMWLWGFVREFPALDALLRRTIDVSAPVNGHTPTNAWRRQTTE